jgi:hypothetical protein
MDLDSNEERVLRLLSETRNREVLTTLENAGRALEVNELADRLVVEETSFDGSAGPTSELERVRITLHHNRLPKLADAGLIEYDYDENVARRNRAAADRMDFESIGELLGCFQLQTDDERIEVIEGRDAAVEHGRRLTDEADEELFLMFVSEDMLEDECLQYASDSIERGVDIYLGSRNPEIRELARERFPEVTLWEPELDWMNVPSSYPTVGRLVLADRERVMLAVLDGPESADASQETAVIGAGEDNPLVVLVRELLGPRLDHLDYQSENFRSELPF